MLSVDGLRVVIESVDRLGCTCYSEIYIGLINISYLGFFTKASLKTSFAESNNWQDAGALCWVYPNWMNWADKEARHNPNPFLSPKLSISRRKANIPIQLGLYQSSNKDFVGSELESKLGAL